MQKITFVSTLLLTAIITFGQPIKRIDGSKIFTDSVQRKIEFLMKTANISGVAVSIFNDNKPVFSNTFGLADVQKNIPFQQTSVMYGASLAKMLFAYIAMQYVQEKVIIAVKSNVETNVIFRMARFY